MSATDVRTVRSFCRICTSVCGILVDVAGDEVVRVRGDHDHPLSHGYTCAKGRALPQMHHHPDRLEQPLTRVDGTLRPTTWDACLDDLGTRLRTIVEQDGPGAIGIFFGSGVGMDAAGYRTAQGLHRAIGTPAKFSPLTIDGTAKVLVSDLVGGSVGLNARPDLDAASFVVYDGCTPDVSHGHTVAMPDPVSAIRALQDHAEVWVLDPRRTETARLATRHLAPRPGTDHAVLGFLVRELLRDGADPDVLARHPEDTARLAAAVEPFTLGHTAHVADVEEADLTDLLDGVRRAGRVAVETGTGVTMAASANVTQWLAWAVMIITGSMNRPGGAWFHPGFTNQMESFELPVSPPEGTFGAGPESRPETQAFLGEWPCAVLADEIRAGNIRAVLNLGGSLLTAFPDANDLVPALEQLEVLATIEIIANDTTALSTHVLPTKDQLERADVTLWDFLSPRIAAQHTGPVVDPVGDRRSTWWVLAESEISITYGGLRVLAFGLGIDIYCGLTSEGFAKWQRDAYDAIMQGYERLRSDYEEKLAASKIAQGVKIIGRNPLENQRMIRDELKKWTIMVLRGSPYLDLDSFLSSTEPTLSISKACKNGNLIRFFENAFEWNNMSFVLYPYFWGRHARWSAALQFSDPDPDFAGFLKAGAARVQVPVRPGFEKAVAYFSETGLIWNGSDPPLIGDSLYVPIVQEITESLGKIEDGVPYPEGSEPWEVTVPTTLVVLQDLTEIAAIRDGMTDQPINLLAAPA